jgi:rod shape-determining protein MreC
MAVSAADRTRIAGISFLLFCLALSLTAYTSKNPQIARAGSSLVLEVIGPIEKFTHVGYRGLIGFWDDYFALIDVKRQNGQLKERLALLEAENSRLLEFESENRRLKGILAVSSEAGLKGIVADVIGYDPSNWVKAVSLNKGSIEGVQIGMPVLEGNGVVGQVISVAQHTSRVLLIVDRSSGVDSILQSTRTRGVVYGLGEDGCELRYALSEEEIKIGERVITSGMDGVYPKGLFIGVVSEAGRPASGLFRIVTISPKVDFLRLETVLIVPGVAPAVAAVKR